MLGCHSFLDARRHLKIARWGVHNILVLVYFSMAVWWCVVCYQLQTQPRIISHHDKKRSGDLQKYKSGPILHTADGEKIVLRLRAQNVLPQQVLWQIINHFQPNFYRKIFFSMQSSLHNIRKGPAKCSCENPHVKMTRQPTPEGSTVTFSHTCESGVLSCSVGDLKIFGTAWQ